MQKKLFLLGAAIIIAGIGIYLYHQHDVRYPSTDDAYVGANTVSVAPQVGGAVDQLLIANHQQVKKGALLYSIERRPYEIALQQAQANLATAELQVEQNQAAVTAAQADVHRNEVLLANAKLHAERSAHLKRTDVLSRQQADDDEANYKAAQANLAVAKANLNEALSKLGVPGADNAAVRAARATVDKAQWDIDHTEIHAQCSGRIGELSLEAGDMVQAGQAGFVLICDSDYWVDANYKETAISRIRVGQPADVSVDMYSDHPFHGVVQSISGASGVAFSMLPPENATGNWVKVTQRVPVRIRITDVDPALPLRVGTSATVTVDTTSLSAKR